MVDTDVLNNILVSEISAVSKLLEALKKQYSYISKDDVFGLEGCVDEIQNCSKDLAQNEIERRKITDGISMNEIIKQSENEDLIHNYEKMKKILQKTEIQKNSNEYLIRQSLSFTTQMLHILNPDRSIKTYNSYGKIYK